MALLSYNTAKYLAPVSFVYDFVAQQIGLNSSPNMQDIHDANLSFFSPQPYFIGGFFAPQQLFQVWWLYRLWRLKPEQSATDKEEVNKIVHFVPYYALGNFCIGTWMFFWNSNNLKVSNIFVIINTLTQLYYCAALLPKMNTNSTSSILTHVVAKTFAGIGVLDLLHNTSAAYFKNQSPSMLVKVLTGVGFGIGAASSDWILGGCLVYDLVALAVGQSGNWRSLLAAYAVGAAAIVGVRNYANPPYEKKPLTNELTAEEEV